MLIHKATMGVLDKVWTGAYHRVKGEVAMAPVYHQVTLADVEDPDNWWEIPSTGPLAKTVRLYYPWITPQLGPDGSLVNVTVVGTARQQAEDRAVKAAKEAELEEAKRRGYKTASRIRPKGLMPFLSCTGRCNDSDNTR